MPGPRPDDPYNPVPQVSPSTQVPNDYLQVRADPGAFGGQIGEAQQGLGKAIQGVGDEQASYVLQKQGLANEHEANQAELQLTVDNGQTYNKFKGLTGLEASNSADQYVQEIIQNNAKIRNGISNPAAQKAYDLLATRRMSFTITDINSRAGDERRSAYRQGNLDSVNLSVDRASRIDVASDPNQFNFELGNVIHQVNTMYTAPDYGKYQSMRPVVNPDGTLKFDDSPEGRVAQSDYDNYLNMATGKAWENRIDTLALDPQKGNIETAVQTLIDNKDKMPASVYARLSAKLSGPYKSEQARSIVDDSIGQALTNYHNQFKTTSEGSSDLTTSFIHQESGGTGTNLGQIQPGTWKEFAKPGEDINNPVDNKAVTKRILDKYSADYNGDVGRIATAYFSGPGNVTSSGPTPYVNGDLKDSNGKSVSSYVQDIRNRTGSQNYSSSGYQSQADYLKANEASLIESARQAAKAQGFDVTVQDQAAARMETRINEASSAEAGQLKATRQSLISKVIDNKNPITSEAVLDNSQDPQVRKDWTNLQAQDYYGALTVRRLIQANASGQSTSYGTDFYTHLTSVLDGKEQPDHLGEYIGGTKAPLSNSGYTALSKEFESLQTPSGQGFATEEKKFLDGIKSHMTSPIPGIKTPELDQLFNNSLQVLIPRIQAGRSSGKTSGQLFDPKSPDFVGNGLIYPSKAKITAAATTASIQTSADKNLPTHLKDISDPNQGVAELHKRVKSGEATPREAADYAIQRGWRKSSKVDTGPQVPRPE